MGAGPAFWGFAVAGMARAEEVGDWVGDNAPPFPDATEAEADAAAAAMVALCRSSVPALAAAAHSLAVATANQEPLVPLV